jgi:hypothetical protein
VEIDPLDAELVAKMVVIQTVSRRFMLILSITQTTL